MLSQFCNEKQKKLLIKFALLINSSFWIKNYFNVKFDFQRYTKINFLYDIFYF